MSEEQETQPLDIPKLPDKTMIVGYAVMVKYIDESGKVYFSRATKDLDDMEALGLAMDMQNDFATLMAPRRNSE